MAYRETSSDKHLQDVRGVLIMQWDDLNWKAIQRGARGADVAELFERLAETIRKELGLESKD